MVNMSDVEVGDVVKLRSGKVIEVERIDDTDCGYYKFEVKALWYDIGNSDWMSFTSDGKFYKDIEDEWDVVEIIKKEGRLENKQR